MRYVGKSAIGKTKNKNEDRFLIKKIQSEILLLAIADGLGGQPAGDIAAQTAIDALDTWMPGSHDVTQDLANLILGADKRVTDLADSDPDLQYMGTTLTVALIVKNRLFWAHVGDVRLYHLKQGMLMKITTDQTMAQFLVEEGDITPAEALTHPMQNLLEQSLGCGNCEPATGSFDLSHKETILMCSDGLYSEVADDDIRQILDADNGIEAKIDLLLKAANDAGGKDNITAVALEF
ncbi:MAG: protein phosphatase 2C domain-containing protein [Pseudomonadota bacterium]